MRAKGETAMRLIGAGTLVYLLAITLAISGVAHQDGQRIFRFDTFGDEQLWTDVLRMHEVVATLDPTTALSVGLKVDSDALPPSVVAALKANQVDLKSPATTALLLRLNAVVGVKGGFDQAGQLTSIGITCALCHSTV